MKISVTLANYNHAAFLTQCINGVRAQTYTDWELFIDDDGSTDDSRQIIEKHASEDPRILPRFFSKNRGAMTAIQACTMRATGTLMISVAADDYISDHRFFEHAVAALEHFPQAAGVFSSATLVNGRTGKKFARLGRYRPSTSLTGKKGTQFISPHEAMSAFLTNRLFIPGAAAIWKRSLFTEIGGYNEALGPQSDYFLNHALAALHGVVFLDKAAVVVREFSNSYSGSASDDEVFRRHALVEKKLRDLDLPYEVDKQLFARWRASFVQRHIGKGLLRQRFDAIRGAHRNVRDWEKRSFTSKFGAYLMRLQEDYAQFENLLDARTGRAQQIFDEIAGVIEPPAPSMKTIRAEPKRRHWWPQA
jgi:glycosyltransferase involved in cell wall biosynthesis